jgi:hypothetical protein
MELKDEARIRRLPAYAFLFAIALLTSRAVADDLYVRVTPDLLTRTEGKYPVATQPIDHPVWDRFDLLPPYAVLDGPGEVFLVPKRGLYVPADGVANPNLPEAICVHTTQPGDITGKLFLTSPDATGMVPVKFKISRSQSKPGDREEFYKAKRDYYTSLASQDLPGSAWFRYEARAADTKLGQKNPADAQITQPWQRPAPEFDDTFSLLSGGRAVSENLQLDRLVPTTNPDANARETVDINSIDGISTQPMDWTRLIKGLNPKTDPLAALIPADQHAIFFPSFEAMTTTLDESEREGGIALQQEEARTEDAHTRERYERQLGISLTALGRALGPELVSRVAVTGSDPYLRVGSDLTIIFEAKKLGAATALCDLLVAQIVKTTAGLRDIKATQGNIGSVAWSARASDDGPIQSYIAQIDNTVVLTNSLQQLQRIVGVHDGRIDNLAKQPEYIFFRDRYKLGEDNETALIVLTDATIRRWCGPRWRIADSRRTRAAAILSDLQATYLDSLVHGDITPSPVHTDFSVPELGDLTLTPDGVVSSTYGSLAMMTPIAQLPIDKVTQAEADAYKRWRDTYETDWRWFFDPIAIRLSIQEKKLAADLTVMPLIWGSDYREFVALTQGVKLAPNAGDPHDTLFQYVIAINKDAAVIRQGANFASSMAPGLKVDPFGWLGKSVTLYCDNDPFWDEVAKAKDPDQFMESNLARLPAALRADVSSPFKLTAFLVAIRGVIEQTAPGMTVWENLSYHDQSYVKITPTEKAKDEEEELGNVALYYVVTGNSFILTLSEPLMKRAIDRATASTQPSPDGTTRPSSLGPWLGESVAAHSDLQHLAPILATSHEDNLLEMQKRAWANLPILNEWKRRYPDQDPVQLHDKIWHATLLDPAGGTYVWNDQWQTMESTIYGCPADPKAGPDAIAFVRQWLEADFGLTFENQGVRARAEVTRNLAANP